MEPAEPVLPATLLVVDDHEFSRDLLARRLGRAGFTVRQADDLPAALAHMAAEPIDLVLLDLMMPDIDGLAALRIMRLRHTGADLPIVVVTAEAASDVLAEAFRRGASDFVAKPVEPAALIARVSHQLRISRGDAVSGLANRRWGMRRLAGALAAAQAARRPCPVLAIALDGLTLINDAHGRQAGDDALATTGIRLSWTLEGRGHAARLVGGKFMAHLTGPDAADPVALVAQLRAALSLPIELPDGATVRLAPRIALAAAEAHGYEGEPMLRAAESVLARPARALRLA